MESKTINETIGVEALDKELQRHPDGVFVIDLMNKDIFASQHIPGAVNIPMEELGNRLSEIPKDKTVVVACRMGLMKSDMALQLLHSHGFNTAKKVEGGTTAWYGLKPTAGQQC